MDIEFEFYKKVSVIIEILYPESFDNIFRERFDELPDEQKRLYSIENIHIHLTPEKRDAEQRKRQSIQCPFARIYPKRASGTYAFFTKYSQAHVDIRGEFVQRAKKLAEVWRSLSPSQKKVFYDLKNIDKARFDRELVKCRVTGGKARDLYNAETCNNSPAIHFDNLTNDKQSIYYDRVQNHS